MGGIPCGMWACSFHRSCCTSLSATLGSVRSLGEATLSLRRKKPPSPPAGVLGVVLAEVMLVSPLLVTVVRLTEGRGLVLVRKSPLVEVSEEVELMMAVASEKSYAVAEDIGGEVAVLIVESASKETRTAPGPSVWLTVLTKKLVGVSSIRVPLEVIVLAVVASLWGVLLEMNELLTLGSGRVGSVMSSVDKLSLEATLLVRCSFFPVKSGPAGFSEVDSLLPPLVRL